MNCDFTIKACFCLISGRHKQLLEASACARPDKKKQILRKLCAGFGWSWEMLQEFDASQSSASTGCALARKSNMYSKQSALYSKSCKELIDYFRDVATTTDGNINVAS